VRTGADSVRIVRAEGAEHWPLVAWSRAWLKDGALLSYGVDTSANFRRAAYYIDRILEGAKPSDLPVEQPAKLELAINAKTAKTLSLAIPARAHHEFLPLDDVMTMLMR
jgi:putative ABC transport system substrate-binding protein